MRKLLALVCVALFAAASVGCASSPWLAGSDRLEDEIGAPPSHFENIAQRGTGVTDRAREIENRLGYR